LAGGSIAESTIDCIEARRRIDPAAKADSPAHPFIQKKGGKPTWLRQRDRTPFRRRHRERQTTENDANIRHQRARRCRASRQTHDRAVVPMTLAAQSVEPSGFSFVIEPDFSETPRLRDLKRYWDFKRGARKMPMRADIDPTELRDHLGWLYIIEVPRDLSDFRYRLLGSRITEAYGRDSTGKTVREIYGADHPDYCEALLMLYRTVARDAVVAKGRGSLSIVHKPFRGYDAIYLPLDRGDGTVGMILAEIQLR
jgi:hypothetical protein